MLDTIKTQSTAAMEELIGASRLEAGDIIVVGCSTSEIGGGIIGKASAPEVGTAVAGALLAVTRREGLYLAAQCCEHLNRALIIEKAAMRQYGLPQVNVLPQPKAGGSFATALWQSLEAPCAVSALQAAAGLDIGLTLIGMHLRPVAVPVRLSVPRIGEAVLVAARTRPPFTGGERAVYDPTLL